jgi:tetratricopeptide (TPR) repeat protein
MIRPLQEQPDTYNHWLAGILAAGANDTASAARQAQELAVPFVATAVDSMTSEIQGQWRFYYHLLGMIDLSRREPLRAVENFRNTLRFATRGDDAYFRTYLGYGLLVAGQPRAAIREFERVLGFNPNYPEALLYMGRAYVAQRDFGRARQPLHTLETLWRRGDRDDPLNQELRGLLHVASSGRE